jgi:hypothetical protein
VGLLIWREDKKIIHIDDQPSFSDEISKGIVHEMLKNGGRIHKAKEHDSGFEETIRGDKGSFPLISISDSDVVVVQSRLESLGWAYVLVTSGPASLLGCL